MKKKTALILLIVLLLVGSFVTFYSGNMLSSDISNMFYGVHDIFIVSSLPLFFITLDFILGILFVLRFYRYPDRRKSIVNLYTILAMVFAILGTIFCILTGVVYKDFMTPYPFHGYCLILLIVNAIIFGLCLALNIYAKKTMKEDSSDHKIKFHYVLYTGIAVVLMFFALYRFGSVMWMVVYAQARTLYLTFPFYLWALIPMALLLHVVFYFLDIYGNYKRAIIYTAIVLGLEIILGAVVVIIGYTNTSFISAISPALPLERLATKPLDVISNIAIIIIVAGYYLIYSIRSVKEHKAK